MKAWRLLRFWETAIRCSNPNIVILLSLQSEFRIRTANLLGFNSLVAYSKKPNFTCLIICNPLRACLS